MNFFDLFVFIVAAGLGISGFFSGFIRSSVKLAGFVAAIIIMTLYSGHIMKMMPTADKLPPKVTVIIAYIVIFIICAVVFHFLAEIIHKIIKITPLGFIDSGLGCALGFIKAFIFCGLFSLLISSISPGSFINEQYKSSRTAEPLKRFVSGAIPFVKSTIVPLFQKYVPSDTEQKKIENGKNSPQDAL